MYICRNINRLELHATRHDIFAYLYVLLDIHVYGYYEKLRSTEHLAFRGVSTDLSFEYRAVSESSLI